MSELFNNTTHLFATPSFIEGMGRIFDLSGSYEIYNAHATPAEADIDALHRDWCAIGQDLKSAITVYESSSSAKS